MTVKSVRGRRRYIAFKTPVNADRQWAEEILSGFQSVKIITCKGGYAVVRASPEQVEAVEDAMWDAWATNLDCSGTLHALRTRHPQLREPRKRRKRPAPPNKPA